MPQLLIQMARHLQGISIPYFLYHDDIVTLLVLACMIVTAFVLTHSYRFLLLITRSLFFGHRRLSIFETSTNMELYKCVLLFLQTCVLSAICIYDISLKLHPDADRLLPSGVIIGIYVGCMLLFVLLKWMLYNIVGWMFFRRSAVSEWIASYFTIVYDLGILLLPWTLAVIYFNLTLEVIVIGGVIVFFLSTFLTIYKCCRLFSSEFYGRVLIIVYFCALETIPMIMMVFGVAKMNKYLFS